MLQSLRTWAISPTLKCLEGQTDRPQGAGRTRQVANFLGQKGASVAEVQGTEFTRRRDGSTCTAVQAMMTHSILF